EPAEGGEVDRGSGVHGGGRPGRAEPISAEPDLRERAEDRLVVRSADGVTDPADDQLLLAAEHGPHLGGRELLVQDADDRALLAAARDRLRDGAADPAALAAADL